MALEAYAETKNKKPYPGVGIRETTRLEYIPADALKWSIDHKICLALDKKAFETLAKTGADIPGVTLKTQTEATIASDLSKYLKVEV